MKKIDVVIIMGSTSDMPTMKGAIDVLREFGVGFEVQVMSAHRTPEDTARFSKKAAARGVKVIIAAAGGAAHLAGVIAGHTTLPVIGVPMQSKALNGLDSLLSTVQMPGGVPVASMAIGDAGAKNASLFAVQILSLSNASLRKKFKAFKVKLANSVRRKNAALKKNKR